MNSPVTAIKGVSPVLPTPFNDDGSLDRVSFHRVIEHVSRLGTGSVMYPAYASEFYSLTEPERDLLLTDLIERVRGPVVVASVPDHATVAAVNRARHYVDLGASAINLLPPYIGRPPRHAVLEHTSAVVAAVGPTPVIVQYVPDETGTELTAADLLELRHRHPNLYAVKVECRAPGPYIRELLAGGVPSLVGNAGIDLPEALEAGAIGVQPGGGFVEIYLDIWRRWGDGDQKGALDLHRRLGGYLWRWWEIPGYATPIAKTIAWRRGIIQSPHCRRPSRTITDHQEADRFIEEFAL